MSSTEKKPEKKRIGVIIDSVHESYQAPIWHGISYAGKKHRVDLISFVSTSQDRIDSFDTHYDVVRDFVVHADLDGLLVLTGSIAEHQGSDFAGALCRSFGDLPLICISMGVPGLPSVEAENSDGIIELIEHFVNIHNYNSIAFIKGPEGHGEAEERFEAYKEGLRRNKLPFKEELVLPGHFSEESGRQAVCQLLESGVHFDAVLAVDDVAAFGVISELRKRGEHVPTQAGVAGFDDVPQSALKLPSLTTVRQPLFNLGETGVDQVLKKIAGETIDERTILPTEPVYRRSCGCFSASVRGSKMVQVQKSRQAKDKIVWEMFEIISPMLKKRQPRYIGDDGVITDLTHLVDSLIWDVDKHAIREIFLNEVDLLLFKFESFSENAEVLETLLIELTYRASSLFSDTAAITEANSILQQAQTLVREHKLRLAQARFYEDTMFQLRLRETSQTIITTFELRRLLNTIASEFPALGIRHFVLALYADEDLDRSTSNENWHFPETSRMLLGYNTDRDIVSYNRGRDVFPTGQIIPEEMYDTDRDNNLIFMPLFFADEHFGHVVFEYAFGQQTFIYEELRLHISSALKSSFLMRDLKIQSMMDELTGLHNRRGFMAVGRRMVETARVEGTKLLLFYADLDKLKYINDTFGHDEGDVAIAGAAEVLRETFRDQDLLARIGGDEFVAILQVKEGKDDLEACIAKRLNQRIDIFNKVASRPFDLSISLGAAILDGSADMSLDEVMKVADDRMMENKKAKKASL